jgi:diadenosine tetraphosphate (Ap4A) HIT family hydrolase
MSNQAHKPCIACQIAEGLFHPHSLPPVAFSHFVVSAKPEPGAVPGWLIIAPKNHIEQIDDLHPDQAAELGRIIHQVSTVLRAVTACEKIYVCTFAEVLHHLHVHIIARPYDLPLALHGPAVFSAQPTSSAEECQRVVGAVLERLRNRST